MEALARLFARAITEVEMHCGKKFFIGVVFAIGVVGMLYLWFTEKTVKNKATKSTPMLFAMIFFLFALTVRERFCHFLALALDSTEDFETFEARCERSRSMKCLKRCGWVTKFLSTQANSAVISAIAIDHATLDRTLCVLRVARVCRLWSKTSTKHPFHEALFAGDTTSAILLNFISETNSVTQQASGFWSNRINHEGTHFSWLQYAVNNGHCATLRYIREIAQAHRLCFSRVVDEDTQTLLATRIMAKLPLPSQYVRNMCQGSSPDILARRACLTECLNALNPIIECLYVLISQEGAWTAFLQRTFQDSRQPKRTVTGSIEALHIPTLTGRALLAQVALWCDTLEVAKYEGAEVDGVDLVELNDDGVPVV